MNPFRTVTSQVTPLPLKDVDTDMIIPAQFLTSISRSGYGENLFRRLRDQDRHFPLNQQKYEGSRILCAESNFGCGSSREHAVWALSGWGFQVVIAKSFADIFFGNAAKNGLVLIALDPAVVDQILTQSAQQPDYSVIVDLESQTVTLPGNISHHFDFDPFRKHCILHGLDDLDYILNHRDEIAQFKTGQWASLFIDRE